MSNEDFLTQLIGDKPSQAQIDFFEKNAVVRSKTFFFLIQAKPDNDEATQLDIDGNEPVSRIAHGLQGASQVQDIIKSSLNLLAIMEGNPDKIK